MSFLSDLIGLFDHQPHHQAKRPAPLAPQQAMQPQPQAAPPLAPHVQQAAVQRQPAHPPLDLTFGQPGLPNFYQSAVSPQGAIRPQIQPLVNGYAQPSYPAIPLQGSGRQVQPSYDNPNDLYTNRLRVY